MAIHTPDTTLSANDKRILNALFDPETLPSSVAKSIDSSSIDASLPPHPNIPDEQLSSLEARQDEIVRSISASSDTATIIAVLKELDEITKTWPTYPSAFLNRAMILRLQLEPSSTFLFSSSISSIFHNLSRAIHTSLPTTCPDAPVSPFQARILRTAYAHRAYLYLKAAESGVELGGKGKSELEELASGDFANAARYGDEVAREMSVRTNPYAKMCGSIVREALREERRC